MASARAPESQGALKGKDVQRVCSMKSPKTRFASDGEPARALRRPGQRSAGAARARFFGGFNLSRCCGRRCARVCAGKSAEPALRMICEREDEIAAFVAREYWSIDCRARTFGTEVSGKLVDTREPK